MQHIPSTLRPPSWFAFSFSAACLLGSAGPVCAQLSYADLYTIPKPPGFNGVTLSPFHVIDGGQVIGYAQSLTVDADHAFLWNSGGITDLHPAGFDQSYAAGISGHQIVGYGNLGYTTHALLWNGSAPAVDLNPATISYSYAYAVADGQIVGAGGSSPTGGDMHALLWDSSLNATDLNPAGFTTSSATGAGGGQQIGGGMGPATGGLYHPLLWNGTNAAVDLLPPGFTSAEVVGVGNGDQIGNGTSPATGNHRHALLWHGTNAATDLNPPGYSYSEAYTVANGFELGWGVASTSAITGGALLWIGSDPNAIELGSLLPATFTNSQAYSIVGNTVYGIASDTHKQYHAIAWTIPEPTGLSTLLLALPFLRRQR